MWLALFLTTLLLAIKADSVQMEQIMMNLVINGMPCLRVAQFPGGSQNVLGTAQPNRLHLYFPVAEADAHNRQATPLSQILCRRAETILLVEDEEQIRVLACLTYKKRGIPYLLRPMGRMRCRLRFNMEGPLLLLTDVIMPGMNGAQLNEQIDTLYPTIKTLYISGYVDSKLAFPHLESTSRAACTCRSHLPQLCSPKKCVKRWMPSKTTDDGRP